MDSVLAPTAATVAGVGGQVLAEPRADAPRTVTIAIPTCGRPVELERCLRAVAAHELPRGVTVEVVTVHAPGDEAVQALVHERFPAVVVIASELRNLSHQRNLAALAARGALVVYLDDDAWPRDGWLRALLAPFEDPAVAAVGGQVLREDGSRQYGPMAVTRFARPIVLADSAACPRGAVPTLPGGNLAVRRDVLLAIGGFDENIRYHFDDVELSLRLAAHGHRACYVDDAAIWHEPAPGPHLRSYLDRDWFIVARNGVYCAFRHVRGPLARTLGLLLVPALLQLPKTLRILAWGATGRLPLRAAARCALGHLAGIAAGYWAGLFRRPALLDAHARRSER